jgi:hypothetical protein
MLNNASPTNVRLNLYTNDKTPSESDALTHYTAAAVSGYTQKELAGSQWTFATTASTSAASYARQTFSFSTSSNVYGWYITDVTNATIIWAERFTGAPYQIPSGGGTIDIDPVLVLA